MSPELFETTEAKHTLESDVWAWACTVFEVLNELHKLKPALVNNLSDFRSSPTALRTLPSEVMVTLYSL